MASTKQNLTVRLERETILRAKRLAAERGTSISQLVAEKIEQAVEEESAYESAQRHALALLQKGFHLGGGRPASREEIHER